MAAGAGTPATSEPSSKRRPDFSAGLTLRAGTLWHENMCGCSPRLSDGIEIRKKSPLPCRCMSVFRAMRIFGGRRQAAGGVTALHYQQNGCGGEGMWGEGMWVGGRDPAAPAAQLGLILNAVAEQREQAGRRHRVDHHCRLVGARQQRPRASVGGVRHQALAPADLSKRPAA